MHLARNVTHDRFEYAIESVRKLTGGKSELVFDVGSGVALMREAVESAGQRYQAFDLDPTEAGIRKWNLEEPLHVDERPGIVLLLEVIEHLWNPQKCLANVAAILPSGGHLILTTPNPKWSRGRFDLLLRHELSCFTRHDLEVNHHVFTGWPHVIEHLLITNGFDILEYVTLESTLQWPNRPLTLSYPARIVKHFLSRMIEAADPASKGMGYAVIARKHVAAVQNG